MVLLIRSPACTVTPAPVSAARSAAASPLLRWLSCTKIFSTALQAAG